MKYIRLLIHFQSLYTSHTIRIFLSNVRTHLCIHLSLFPFPVPVQRHQVFSMPAQIIEFHPFSVGSFQSHWYMPVSKNCSSFLSQPRLYHISFLHCSPKLLSLHLQKYFFQLVLYNPVVLILHIVLLFHLLFSLKKQFHFL